MDHSSRTISSGASLSSLKAVMNRTQTSFCFTCFHFGCNERSQSEQVLFTTYSLLGGGAGSVQVSSSRVERPAAGSELISAQT